MKYTLVDCEERNREHPDTFELPDGRGSLRSGMFAKLIFKDPEGDFDGERMWVAVTGERSGVYVGTLANDPVLVDLDYGDEVEFDASHVCAILA